MKIKVAHIKEELQQILQALNKEGYEEDIKILVNEDKHSKESVKTLLVDSPYGSYSLLNTVNSILPSKIEQLSKVLAFEQLPSQDVEKYIEDLEEGKYVIIASSSIT
ncbi:general stress protein [Bacillus sp. JZ8]